MSKQSYRGGPSHTGWVPGKGATPSGGLHTAKWDNAFDKPAAREKQTTTPTKDDTARAPVGRITRQK